MITGLYAGILALMYIGLSAYVISKRLKHKISLGNGENEELIRAIRIHGNFSEFIPIALILMIICEINATQPFAIAPQFIHAFGIALVLGRILHAIGMTNISLSLSARRAGMILTFLSLLGLGGLLIYQFVRA